MIYQLCQFACDPVTETTFRDEVTQKTPKHWDALWNWEEKM